MPTNVIVTFTYNERMNPLSVNSQTFQVSPQATGIPVAASYTISSDGRSISVQPAAPLAASTTYTAVASGATDLVGHATFASTSFTTGPGAQTTGPTVAVLSPPDGSTDVPLNARVTARMSAAINAASVGADAIVVAANGAPVAGAVTVSGDRTIVFTPAAALTAATAYTVTVAGLTDLAGNAGQPSTTTFTTGAAPVTTNMTVTSVAPPNGATNVVVDIAVRITFARTVDPTTVSVSTVTLSTTTGNLSAGYQAAGNVVTVTPASPLPGNAQVNVQVNGVRDLAGNLGNFIFQSFRTAATIDTTPPTVLSVTPAPGTTGVGPNAPIVITFSESLNPATVNSNTLALFANGARFGFISSISQDNRTVFMSGGTMPAGSEVTIAATSAVQDVSGNPLADFTSTFRTGSGFDTSRPSVVGQRPGSGASGVGLTIPLVLFLNERIDPLSATGALHVSQNGQIAPGTVQVTGNGQVITFRPADPWAPNALIQVFVDSSARDANGNTLIPYQSSFRTADDPATTIPIVISTNPTIGSSGNARNIIVTLGFNVALDPSSVTDATVLFTGPDGQEDAALSSTHPAA